MKVKSITGSGATAVGQLEYSGVSVFEPNVLQESFHNDTNAITGTYNHDILTYGMVWNGWMERDGLAWNGLGGWMEFVEWMEWMELME